MLAVMKLDIDLIDVTQKAAHAAQDYAARAAAQNLPSQAQQHGLAWVATYAQALVQLANYAHHLTTENRLKGLEEHLLCIVFGEYLHQLKGGVMMSQNEFIRPSDFGLEDGYFTGEACQWLLTHGNTPARRHYVAELMASQTTTRADSGLDDTHQLISDQFARFADERVAPYAHDWHLKDELIPLSLISELAELGVFGLTIPEAFGGGGMGKQAMCVVSEELSRGYIGVGSLGTRTDIAAELILQNGTKAQQQKYLPLIANGTILPTAVFTEPDYGSDLANLTTRAEKKNQTYYVTGNKTWITHAARADLMTLLVRTSDVKGHAGLSMLLAEKPRQQDGNDFPAKGMEGGEIEVLGYRGMKEYDIRFDGFEVDETALLGGGEGQGFKQLMKTFESARIQTAARAIGVAQAALDIAFAYAHERLQFGQPIYQYDRVQGKIVMMAAEIMAARQLTYYAAKTKDKGERCDLEAGMAKLLAARVAWAAADNGLQIHGGNGFALEYPISRLLCDARILNIFEGAAEIQAEVISRRLQEK